MNGSLAFRMIAVAVLAAGLAMTAQSVSSASRHQERIANKLRDLASLRELRHAQARCRGAVDTFNNLPQTRPIAPAEILAARMPHSNHAVRLKETRPVAEGWSARVHEVSFDNVYLPQLSAFLEDACKAGNAPPWRLNEMSIAASDQEAGYARVTLVMEALEKRADIR